VLRFTHLELFLVRVLIPCASIVGVLSFFLQELNQYPQRGVCWKCYPFQGSCCGVDYLFSALSEVRGLEFLLFDWGTGTLLQSQRGVLGFCAPWEVGLLVPAQ
jgi:hypothetical protein